MRCREAWERRIFIHSHCQSWLSASCISLPWSFALRRISTKKTSMKSLSSLSARIQRFAPTLLTADAASLSPGDQAALQKIIAAAKYFDPLYRQQIWSGSEALLKVLESDKSGAGREREHYFRMNQGPWSRLDENEAFIEGVPARLPQANFYPADITKEEFQAWLSLLPSETKA